MKTKLIILGAGCSQPNYPLAKDMRAFLKAFGEQVKTTAPRIYATIERTLQTFTALDEAGYHPETIDDLAGLVDQGILHDSADEKAYSRVEDAKLAIAAAFRAQESIATKSLSGYRRLLRRIIPDAAHYRLALSASEYRVLSFNYDRLFEIAFCQSFKLDPNDAFYGPNVLNSGLYPHQRDHVKVERDRFSFVKLHGSVGLYCVDRFGTYRHVHDQPSVINHPNISDDELFNSVGDAKQSRRPKPVLIVFPHERRYLKGNPDMRLPFRSYLSEIWEAAREFASTAEEIEIIGHSADRDWETIKWLVLSAQECKRVVVHNPVATAICARLRAHMGDLRAQLISYDAPFDAH